MKTLLITLIFILSIMTGCGDSSDEAIGGSLQVSGSISDFGGGSDDVTDDNTSGTDDNTSGADDNTSGTEENQTKKSIPRSGDYVDLASKPSTENMTNDNKSFSSPRGR
jgi:hypothetical protein